MGIEAIGFTISLIGKIMIGYSAIRAHGAVVKEKRIDQVVVSGLIKERAIAIAGIAAMVAGYLIELPYKL